MPKESHDSNDDAEPQKYIHHDTSEILIGGAG